MSLGQVARRYAKGWLSAAKDKKAQESVAGDCNALLAMIASSPDFRAFLTSPLISQADQIKAVGAVADKAKFHALTAALLKTMAEARRLPALQATLEATKAMLDAESGTTQAEVTSATPLDEKKVADIRESLSKKLGKDVAIQTKIDPEIMGGLVVRVGSTMIDDSVKTKLDRMARRLRDQAA